MGEHGNHEKSRIYESIAPEIRFVAMATSILENIGQMPPENGGTLKIARWPKDQHGDHYKLQASAGMGMWGTPIILITLDHYAPGLPANVPKNRYNVQSGFDGISPITITDSKNIEKQLEKDAKQEAVRFILGALTEMAPEVATKYLHDAFEHRFASLVGNYVLSDFALEWPTRDMSEKMQNDAYAQHEKHIDEVMEEELKQAKERKENVVDPSIALSQPAYFEIVQEAATEGRRGPTNMNTYLPIDVHVAMKRVVREMNGKWRNAITPETGQYPTLPETSPET